eukprot:8406521-Karenia_brevis.AAC.1
MTCRPVPVQCHSVLTLLVSLEVITARPEIRASANLSRNLSTSRTTSGSVRGSLCSLIKS